MTMTTAFVKGLPYINHLPMVRFIVLHCQNTSCSNTQNMQTIFVRADKHLFPSCLNRKLHTVLKVTLLLVPANSDALYNVPKGTTEVMWTLILPGVNVSQCFFSVLFCGK